MKYNFTCQNRVFSASGATEREAVEKVIDKHFESFYGPRMVKNGWEIYSVNGMKIFLDNHK